MQLKIPDLSLVVLIGPSGSGKSTFARRHFLPTEVVSSDWCRAAVADDETDQEATGDAFELLHFVIRKRLALRRLAVVDATNVQAEDRKKLLALAREHHVLPVAVVLDLPERLCHERNRTRETRSFGRHVVAGQRRALRRSLGRLKHEGFRYVYVLRTQEEVDGVTVERTRLWTDRRDDSGPFDIIGDLHGCGDELEDLLARLGYEPQAHAPAGPLDHERLFRHPGGRRAVFLGDLVDRGPRSLDCLRLVQTMVKEGQAVCVPGNHDVKLLRKLRGRDVQVTHGLDRTLAEIESLPAAAREGLIAEAIAFLDGLVSHLVFDGGKLVVAHAGMKEALQNRASGRVREFALYGETTGETDEFGLPVRHDWAAEYRGRAAVVYGHTPVPEPEWLNGTINIDTGCVFGGKLTALRYPERELVSVAARRTHAEPSRPFLPVEERPPALSAQHQHDDVLDFEDVCGKRQIGTRLQGTVTVREENAAAALEVMTRFAIDAKWLIYLPPTMAPCETSTLEGLLEHPREAFAYYRESGVPEAVCEEKHMGSRAVLVVCRDEAAARRRFGGVREAGACITRTGRRFFHEAALEDEVLERVRRALGAAGLWEELATTWVCLDCEVLPWSVKAGELIQHEYAPVAAAGRAALAAERAALEGAAGRGVEIESLRGRAAERAELVEQYARAYRRYSSPVRSSADIRVAPFHLLASEGGVHIDRDHLWHLEVIARLCRADPGLLLATRHEVVRLTDPASEAAAIRWWEDLTAAGAEGMVVKPLSFVASSKRGLVQPAVKCRGREYLRIIYGPEYTLPENLERLRQRGLGAKSSLARREFALGIEALERFVRGEPLRRVHECVFGVLALESEPVDPRL